MNLYLIRHGRQNSTLCNVNVPLSEEGKQQASLVGRRLSNYQIDAIVSSDLIRAKETASIIQEELENANLRVKLEYFMDSDLREIDYGQLEGIENDEVKVKYNEYFAAQDKMREDLIIPGGECGEEVYRRAMKAVHRIIEMDKDNVVIVTHGGTIRSLVSGLVGMKQAKRFLLGKTLENTGITQLYYDKEKNRFYLERFNDYAHLEADPKLLRKYF
ncbi:alpha-ribazole-5'-phosphate phosphatase [Lachnospiraceae bacterium KM106-2]|nr:alpha-ribazole-5'-phosphate phosphatase [Lachnospiraceae bacterium KM106-2]